MKLRASTKIAIGFVALVGGGYAASKGYTQFKLRTVDMKPIEPGRFCLIAIGNGAGVKILTANRMVQVVEASSGFSGDSGQDGGTESGSIKGRIPVKELLAVLGGDAGAISGLLERIEKKDDSEAPSEDAPLWSANDLKKALDGDPALQKKLEADINATLDGEPMPALNTTAFYSGIRIECPVQLDIENASQKPLEGVSIKTYKTRFVTELYKKLESTFYDAKGLQDRYNLFIKEKGDAINESPRKNLSALLKSAQTETRYQKAMRVASNTKVIVGQPMVESASWSEEGADKDKTYTLKLKLTEEGANRLWKYSTEHPSDKIIVISKSVAIAAANVGTALNSRELVIKQIADRALVEEAVGLVESRK